jgi:flagellar motor switch protein FliN/FliY
MSSSPSSSSSSEAPVTPPAADPLGWLMDLSCPVDFVLGTSTIKVRECAALVPSSIVRLRQPAGADLEVRVSGVPVAAGEVVIVNEHVGVRMSRILPPPGRGAA